VRVQQCACVWRGAGGVDVAVRVGRLLALFLQPFRNAKDETVLGDVNTDRRAGQPVVVDRQTWRAHLRVPCAHASATIGRDEPVVDDCKQRTRYCTCESRESDDPLRFSRDPQGSEVHHRVCECVSVCV
jgi:hypothetical protein